MKHPTTFAALASLTLAGCNGAYWGNLLVLAVSVGVFYGTLTLQRGAATRSATASRSGATDAHFAVNATPAAPVQPARGAESA